MKIRDPIHGYIEVREEEKELLDSAPVQRLRNIRQLGFSNLVYPSANHTRFEHTLGVLKNAQRYAESLELDEERTKELRVAAILHDTGHGPWSHLSEAITGVDHEDISCEHVDNLEDKFEADSDRVKKIIRGELEIGQVIHGDVDADRMDYLQRDSYMTGVEHGMIDSETIINNSMIDSRRLVYDYKAIQALESLLVARSHMLRSVYQHHAVNIADAMIKKAAEEMPMKFNMSWDDKTAHQQMMQYGGPLYHRVVNRNLYKRAGELSMEPEKARIEITNETGLGRDKVLADRLYLNGQQNELGIKVKYYDEIRNLSDISPVPEAMSKKRKKEKMTKIYTPKENVEDVREAVEGLKEDG